MTDNEQESGLDKLGQKPVMSGLDKLKGLVKDETEETESNKERKEADKKSELARTKEKKEKDSFVKMVKDFEDFLENSNMYKQLNLKLMVLKPGEYLVYRGDPSDVWAWLRFRGCRFERTSLLRGILGLKDSAPLKKYFKDYSRITGGKIV